MRFYLGKALEILGMSLLGFGLMEGMFNPAHGMRNEYALLAAGSAVFFLGWMLERGQRSG